MTFECEIIDYEGYSDTLIIRADDIDECYMLLDVNYHVQRVCGVREL